MIVINIKKLAILLIFISALVVVEYMAYTKVGPHTEPIWALKKIESYYIRNGVDLESIKAGNIISGGGMLYSPIRYTMHYNYYCWHADGFYITKTEPKLIYRCVVCDAFDHIKCDQTEYGKKLMTTLTFSTHE